MLTHFSGATVNGGSLITYIHTCTNDEAVEVLYCVVLIGRYDSVQKIDLEISASSVHLIHFSTINRPKMI